jgi:hypothetical protein
MDPSRPPVQSGNDNSRGTSSKGWIFALVIVGIITAIIVVIILFGTGRIGGDDYTPATEDTNSSKPTISAWDETSSPSPPPSNSAGGGMVDCPVTKKSGNTPQTSGRLRADSLSAATVPGWTLSDSSMYLYFAYDSHAQYKTLYQSALSGWQSNVFVGLLANEDGFTEIGLSARQTLDCLGSNSSYYDGYSNTEILSSQQISVSGYPAWWIQANIYVDHELFPVKGDRVDIVVVDLGPTKDHLGLYMNACTIDMQDNCAEVDASRESLSVDG